MPISKSPHEVLLNRVVAHPDVSVRVCWTSGHVRQSLGRLPWRPSARQMTRPSAICQPPQLTDGGADRLLTTERGGRLANARAVLQGYPLEMDSCSVRRRLSAISIRRMPSASTIHLGAIHPIETLEPHNY